MNYLVGDIGNTSIKISILNYKFAIKKSYNLDTKKIYHNKNIKLFFKKILAKNLDSRMLFSSVVPKAYKVIRVYLIKRNFQTFEVKDLKIKKILKLDIKNFSQLGSDRIVNAIGVNKSKNCLIIDFGTATTFDIIRNGRYDGGVIAPGVDLSIINLNKSAALLPLLKLKNKQKSFGKNTKEALNAGFLWGYEGLINNIINKIIIKSKKNYKIILTGGYAKLFKKFIKNKTTVDQNITIKGIAKVYKELLL
jgi:type III pantothenate kinase